MVSNDVTTIRDPTIDLIASLKIHPFEGGIASILLIYTIIAEILALLLHRFKDENLPISRQVTRSPEKNFQGINEPFQSHYTYVKDTRVEWKSQKLRMHYLREGDPNSSEIIVCLHGEPFWSQSFHRIIPSFTSYGYQVVVPDLVGFGRSDKYVDWRAYDLELHKSTLLQFLDQIHITNRYNKNITLVGHNWGFLLGAAIIKDHPHLFDRLVILNVNNLPDGELNLRRFYGDVKLFSKYLIFDAMFLSFRASISLFRSLVPPRILFKALGSGIYTASELNEFCAPFKRKTLDRGGMVSFPLMVPILPTDVYAEEFRQTRHFFASGQWGMNKTLVVFSERTIVPFLMGEGDFIVGNRKPFFNILIKDAKVTPRIRNAGHIVMYDKPKPVAYYINKFILDSYKAP